MGFGRGFLFENAWHLNKFVDNGLSSNLSDKKNSLSQHFVGCLRKKWKGFAEVHV